jgi:hypothetical protein
MDSEDVSRETFLRSVCGEMLHPNTGKYFTLARAAATEYSPGALEIFPAPSLKKLSRNAELLVALKPRSA